MVLVKNVSLVLKNIFGYAEIIQCQYSFLCILFFEYIRIFKWSQLFYTSYASTEYNT